MIEILRSSALGEVPHGFLGRRGGVSIGIYAGLNVGLGSADDHSTIVQNRILAREAVLPGSMLVTVHQVHSADTVTVTAPIPEDARPSADAMVTDRPGLLLGILTADCVPVLRSEEHTSELQSLMRFSYAVFFLKKNNLFHYHF